MTDLVLTDAPDPGEVVDGIAFRHHGEVTEIVLSRPDHQNALNLAMWRRLEDIVDSLASFLGIVLIRGAGAAFSAGADIREFSTHRFGEAATSYNAAVAGAIRGLMAAPGPVVAMLHGFAVGGGCELACACDIRVAAEGARFGVPIKRLGVTVGSDEARAMVRVLGPGRAKDLLLTGRLIEAEEALRIGLVDRLVPGARLADEVRSVIHEIATGSPLAAAVHKLTVDAVADGSIEGGAERIAALNDRVFSGRDVREGVEAFLAKREPRFARPDEEPWP
ncbi:MAG: enoyl-CoA hydratase/isomerase family protein [Acidimicrobiia bacterium]